MFLLNYEWPNVSQLGPANAWFQISSGLLHLIINVSPSFFALRKQELEKRAQETV
jgi:hypothetical protein